jgi:GT2 family glycosyltransferase
MVGVVIPHHSQRDALARAIASVRGCPVVVVDDSPDGGLSVDGVDVIRTEGGEGFARAVNRGLRAVESMGCTLAMVLNDDAVLAEGALDALLSNWSAEDGALAPILDEPSGPVYGICVSPWGRVQVATSPGPVQALSGAAILMRATERFDERYRHGFEDLELCRRLSRRGLGVRVIEEARCAHAGGATVGRRTRAATRAAIDGHLRFVDGGAAGCVAVCLAVAQVCVEGPRVSRMIGIAQGVGDFFTGRRSA